MNLGTGASPYFVRTGVQSAQGEWRLYRLPLRTQEFSLGAPNIRLVKHLRVTVVGAADQGGPDVAALFALARMRFLGAPWVRRSDRPIASLAGATSGPTGEVVASTISTENQELGYVSPPGVISGLDRKGGSQGDVGTQINERSLRIIGRSMEVGERAEAYFRFPSGPQNLLRYRELRAWVRGRGPGWDDRRLPGLHPRRQRRQQFLPVQHHSRRPRPGSRSSGLTWSAGARSGRQIESRRLQGLPADSVARVACGGDTVSVAYVLCDGPYLATSEIPAVNPPNLAQVQEIAAGSRRVGTIDPTPDAELWVDDIRLVEPISRVGSAMAVDARLIASDVGELSVGFVRQDGYFQQIGQRPQLSHHRHHAGCERAPGSTASCRPDWASSCRCRSAMPAPRSIPSCSPAPTLKAGTWLGSASRRAGP